MRIFFRLLLQAAAVTALLALLAPGRSVSIALQIYSRLSADPGVAVARDVAFGPRPRQLMDIYTPASPSASDSRRPVVLFIHGGSWKSGDKAMYGFVGTALAARGYPTTVANYRLYPDAMFPDFIEDAASAYSYVAANMEQARQHGIVLMGHSAGAYNAAMLALDTRFLDRIGQALPRPRALVGLAGPYAFDPTTWPSTKDVFASAPSADAARPVAFAGPHAPAALLMHGLEDETVKLYNTRDLATALSAAGVRVETVELAGLGHFGIVQALARGFRWRAPVLERVTLFLDRITAI